MLDELKKSVNAVLYERTTSPFFGTLIISWLIWNWKIPYLTFFVSETTLACNKIDYIQKYYCNNCFLIVYPAISTLILLTLIPFISNGAFWLTLQFNQWKKVKKNAIEKKELLTLEQSIELRQEILIQESKFEKLINKKDLEITQLRQLIDNDNPGLREKQRVMEEQLAVDKLKSLAIEYKIEPIKIDAFNSIIRKIQEGQKLVGLSPDEIDVIGELTNYELVKNQGSARYSITERGKDFMRLLQK